MVDVPDPELPFDLLREERLGEVLARAALLASYPKRLTEKEVEAVDRWLFSEAMRISLFFMVLRGELAFELSKEGVYYSLLSIHEERWLEREKGWKPGRRGRRPFVKVFASKRLAERFRESVGKAGERLKVVLGEGGTWIVREESVEEGPAVAGR